MAAGRMSRLLARNGQRSRQSIGGVLHGVYGKPAANHFRNIAKSEFSGGRLQLLENRIQRVKRVTNDLLVEAHGSHPEVQK